MCGLAFILPVIDDTHSSTHIHDRNGMDVTSSQSSHDDSELGATANGHCSCIDRSDTLF